MNKIIYMDNASTTKIYPEVLDAMIPYLSENFGNPSNIYSIGQESHKAVENARKIISECINCSPDEIFFTSGGTESDNWAIKSSYESKSTIISSKIEHHAVLKSLKSIKDANVVLLSPDSYGTILPESLEKEISSNSNISLVSIMTANNEIGTIEPIEEYTKICRNLKIRFHTDAVQAVGHIDIDVKKLGIDLLSSSAHKFGGPKGVGFLYIKKEINIKPLIDGGQQERNRRAGTENVASIVGMAKALEMSVNSMKTNRNKLLEMQKMLFENILKIEETILTGHPTNRIPGSASFCFKGIEGESILLNLDALGICASSGSACTSGSLDPSHVLLSIGLSHEIAHGSLRLTLNSNNSIEDVEYLCSVLPGVISKLRAISPLW